MIGKNPINLILLEQNQLIIQIKIKIMQLKKINPGKIKLLLLQFNFFGTFISQLCQIKCQS